MDDDNGRELFASMMEMYHKSESSVEDKVTVAKAGITYFAEILRVAFPEQGESMALAAASKEMMDIVDEIEHIKKGKKDAG